MSTVTGYLQNTWVQLINVLFCLLFCFFVFYIYRVHPCMDTSPDACGILVHGICYRIGKPRLLGHACAYVKRQHTCGMCVPHIWYCFGKPRILDILIHNIMYTSQDTCGTLVHRICYCMKQRHLGHPPVYVYNNAKTPAAFLCITFAIASGSQETLDILMQMLSRQDARGILEHHNCYCIGKPRNLGHPHAYVYQTRRLRHSCASQVLLHREAKKPWTSSCIWIAVRRLRHSWVLSRWSWNTCVWMRQPRQFGQPLRFLGPLPLRF